MPIKLTIVNEAGDVSFIDVSRSSPIANLSEMIQIELSIPSTEQELRFNGTLLSPSATVSSSGLSDGDLIVVSRKHSSDQPMPDPARRNPTSPSRSRSANPSLAQRATDPLRSVAQALGRVAPPAPARDTSSLMSADAQKAIEEKIRMENVLQNMQAAMEHNPESFGSVVMLFVDCKVNSVSGVKAFVDSGAQATIISKACAERCNILRLLDRRFHGEARGVGTAKIHGRIHLALLTLGTEVFEITFTVMDAIGGEYDVLLGLDMLRKHQASIDLANNCLRIGNSSVPFLAEKDIPKRMLGRREDPGGPSSLSPSRRSGSSSHSGRQPNSPPVRPGGGSRRSSGGGREHAVSGLIEMGFQRSDAEAALNASNGNAEQAAAMLAARKYGF